MVTGIETAGLVLAVLPLIISALEHYNEGLKPLKDFMRYNIVIRKLIVDLLTQKALFRNTLEKLLGGLVTDDVAVALLLDDPVGPGWKSKKLESDLRLRLRHSFVVYMENVTDMDRLVVSLKENMGLDSQGKPGWSDARSHKKAWRKFVMCLSRKDQESLLSRMAQNNSNLKNLTKDSLDLEPVRLSRRRGTEPFQKIRDCARSLHSVLKLGWSCTCRSPHSANLRLETRDVDSAPSFRVMFPSANASSSTQPMQMTWKETVIRPMEHLVSKVVEQRMDETEMQLTRGLAALTVTEVSSQFAMISSTSQMGAVGGPLLSQAHSPLEWSKKSHSTKKKVAWAAEAETEQRQHIAGSRCTQAVQNQGPQDPTPTFRAATNKIPNLCLALKEAQCKGKEENCLGHLDDDGKSLGVYTIGQHHMPLGPKTTTLRDILSAVPRSLEAQASVPLVPSMTQKTRLQLAATLASTALQLQMTPWLSSKWSAKDVLFHDCIPEHPYVTKSFSKDSIQPEQPNADTTSPVGMFRNESIFNLGVLLLELTLGKPLDCFKSPQDPQIFTDYFIARRLAETLAEEASFGYADAVKACIHCDFGRDVKNHTLDNDTFRQAVYDHVVAPLEDEWKQFNGIK